MRYKAELMFLPLITLPKGDKIGHSDPEITINVYTDATRQKIDEDFGRFTQQREEQQDRWNKNQ